MTQDEIVTMAREAGLVRTGDKWVEPARWGVTELIHFATLVAAAEREACAAIVEQFDGYSPRYGNHLTNCADAIRARGTHES